MVLWPPMLPACPPPADCATAQAPYSKIVPVKTNTFRFIFCPSKDPICWHYVIGWMLHGEGCPSSRRNKSPAGWRQKLAPEGRAGFCQGLPFTIGCYFRGHHVYPSILHVVI